MYSIQLKKRMCEEIRLNGASTIKTAEKYGVPLKTLEKWITAYNKDPKYFDENDKKKSPSFEEKHFLYNYDEMNHDELIVQLYKRDIELDRLKRYFSANGNKE